MKDSPLRILATKTILLSVFGLSTLPFLAVVARYLDSVSGFSSGRGYHTNYMDYMFEAPLIYIGIILCVNIIWGTVYLIRNSPKTKSGDSR